MCRAIHVSGLIGFCLLAALAATGQDDRSLLDQIGLPDDWSHRHVIFSQPESAERLSQMQTDIRYRQQISRTAARPAESAVVRRPKMTAGKVDWSEALSTASINFANPATYPAKYSFNVFHADCSNDFVVFDLPTGASAAANVFAFSNLYVNNSGTGTCAGTTPAVLFTYNGSRSGGGLSSPVLSLDGTEIAFIENATSAQFHVLKWKAGNVSPVFGQPWNSSVLPDCAANGAVAPCEYSIVYSTHTATQSAPYVDYGSDTAYVTDDNGLVAAISPVFGGGTPRVVYSINLAGAVAMTAPVYDSVSKNVFAADANGVVYYVRTASSSSGACVSGSAPCAGTPTLTAAQGSTISDAPLVDSQSGTVFVFTKGSVSSPNDAVIQTNTSFSMPARFAYIGPSGANPVYDGTFNNEYYASPIHGLLYACGTDSNNIPQLYAISFTGILMNQGPAAYGPLPLGLAPAACSPLTEVYNQSVGKDFVFLGVTAGCFSANAAHACVEEFDTTTGFPSARTGVVPETNGTTGIIIDNVSNGVNGNPSQTNLYFVSLGQEPCSEYTGGSANLANCLVKLTQTGLQ